MGPAYGGLLGRNQATMRPHCAEKSPVPLEDVHGLSSRDEVSCARLRQAVGCSDLPQGCAGLGKMLEHATALRRAASVCLAILVIRWASEITGLRTSDVSVDEGVGAVELKVRLQKNDQLGVGERAHVVALPSWRGSRPFHLTSGWSWFAAGHGSSGWSRFT